MQPTHRITEFKILRKRKKPLIFYRCLCGKQFKTQKSSKTHTNNLRKY